MTCKTIRAARSRILFKWPVVLLIVFATLLLLGSIGCVILYKYATVYETTRAEKSMDELLESMDKDSWLNALTSTADRWISEFEDAPTLYSHYFNSTLRDLEFTYRNSISQSTKLKKIFWVRAGGMDVAEVTFSAKTDSNPGFGRHYWYLSDITVSDYTKYLSSIEVTVEAPVNHQVFINGIPVSDSYLIGVADLPNTQDIELLFPSRTLNQKFKIGAMYGDVIVTDSSGKELAAVLSEEAGTCTYQCLPTSEEIYSISIEAPEDVTVLLNGVELKKELSRPSRSIFEHYPEYYSGCEWNTVVYSFDHLYTKPEITARDSFGNSLSPIFSNNGNAYVFYPNDTSLQTEMEQTVMVYLNKYMDYSSKHCTWRDLTAVILPRSELSSYVIHSSEAMYWASKTDVSFNHLEISNFRRVGPTAFFCTIQYDATFTAHNWYEEYSYDLDNCYQMIFIQYGKRWYAAEMRALS